MITIREMQIDDLEQVMPIEEANFSIPWTETGFFTFLIRDDALFLVAEEDGEILGYLGILISFDESEITNVCVAEKARRRGIGRALMEEKGARDSSGCAHRQYAGTESVREPRLCTGRHAKGVLRSPEGGRSADEPDG